MNITKADVAKFRKLYLKHYGEELTYKQASNRLDLSARLMDAADAVADEEQFIDMLSLETLINMNLLLDIKRGNHDNN